MLPNRTFCVKRVKVSLQGTTVALEALFALSPLRRAVYSATENL